MDENLSVSAVILWPIYFVLFFFFFRGLERHSLFDGLFDCCCYFFFQELIEEYAEEGTLNHHSCDAVLNFVWNQV